MEKTTQQRLQEALTIFLDAINTITQEGIARFDEREKIINQRLKEAAIAEEDKQLFLQQQEQLQKDLQALEREKQIDRERKMILSRKEALVDEQRTKLRTLMGQLET